MGRSADVMRHPQYDTQPTGVRSVNCARRTNVAGTRTACGSARRLGDDSPREGRRSDIENPNHDSQYVVPFAQRSESDSPKFSDTYGTLRCSCDAETCYRWRTMKPSEALRAHRAELREIVTRHGALRPRVFGSAIRGGDTEESDLDLLVDPTPRTTLMTLAAIQ